jgi:hypothetical protein
MSYGGISAQRRWLSGLVCARVHDTRVERLGERQYVGATPGSIATLQTWSQPLSLHPHSHGLVRGGGLSATGQWVVMQHGFLWPRRVVMARLRGKLVAAIRQELAPGRRQLPPGPRPQPLANRLNQLGRQQWHVHSRARDPHGAGVLISRARSRRGGPRSPRRLLACDDQPVVCRDDERAKGPGGKAKPGTRRLPREPFVGRFLRHVPPPHSVRVRCWGL